MATVNLSPYTAESEAIARRLRMAEALNQQSMLPIEMPTQAGVRISPYAGLAKLLQAGTAAYMQSQGQTQEEELGKRYAADTGADFQSLAKLLSAPAQAAVPEGAPTYTPNIGAGELADNARMTMQPERNEIGEIIQPGQAGAGNFGVTPGAPAQAAIAAGRLTPEGFGAMKTPMGQQQYMAQLLGQMKPREPIKLGKDESLFDPVTLKPIYQPTVAKNKPILVGNVLVDPDTLKPVYTGERAPVTPPSMVAEYTFAKTPDGGNFKGSFQDFVTARATAGRAPAAPRPEQPPVAVIDPVTGKQIFVTREEAIKNRMTPATGSDAKPLSESQSNAVAFGMRMKEANSILEDLSKTGVVKGAVIESTPFIGGALGQALPSFLGGTSAEQQQVNQAKSNFITAVLRKESGASISPSEFANEDKKYFPQVNDSDGVIKQKTKARQLAIKAIEIQAGPGAKNIQEYDPRAGGGLPNASANDPLGIGR